jgi:sugar O-acyltransferase (sialic acid O-acetyltransferase NeuD family)
VLQTVVQAATTALHKTIRPSNNSAKSSKLSNLQEETMSSTLSSKRSLPYLQRSCLDQGYLQQACGFEAQMVTIQQAISSIIKQEMGGAELHPEQPFMASGISSAANSLTDASAISRAITEMVSEIIGVDPPADESVMTLGLGSARAMELSGRLSKRYGRRLPPTFVFKHPTIYSMVEFFTQGSTPATASSTVPQLVNAEYKDEPRVGYKQWSGSLNRLDKPLYLLASGGHSRTVIGQLKALDVPIAGIFTNLEKHVGTTLMGVKVLGLLEEVPAPTECFLHICLGQPLLKQEWAARFSTHTYVTIVHPMAGVDESCTMGEGSFIGALALVDGLVSIGAHSIVEGHSVVGHDTSIGSFTLIGGMAAIAGSSVIGDGVVLGTHSSTAPKVRLGNRAVLGSGSSAHSNIPEDCTAVGVPAEVLYEGVAIKM